MDGAPPLYVDLVEATYELCLHCIRWETLESELNSPAFISSLPYAEYLAREEALEWLQQFCRDRHKTFIELLAELKIVNCTPSGCADRKASARFALSQRLWQAAGEASFILTCSSLRSAKAAAVSQMSLLLPHHDCTSFLATV